MGGDDEIGTEDTFRIGAWLVRPRELTLSQGGKSVPLEAKVMDVLVELARAQGRVVTREALIEAVWGTEYGGDESLTRAISLIRRALGDSRGEHNHIRTVPKRGYQLIADVHREAEEAPAPPAAAATLAEAPAPARPAPARPEPAAAGRARAWPRPGLWVAAILAVAVLAAGMILTRSGLALDTPATAVVGNSIEIADFTGPPGDLRSERFSRTLTGVFAALSIRTFQAGETARESHQRGEFIASGLIDLEDSQGTLTVQLEHVPSGLTLLTSSTTAPLDEFDNAAQIALSNLGNVMQCTLTYRTTEDGNVLLLLVNLCEAFTRWDVPVVLERSQAFLTAAPDSPAAKGIRAYAVAFQSFEGQGDRSTSQLAREARTLASDMIEHGTDLAIPHVALIFLENPEDDYIAYGRLIEGFSADQPDRFLVRNILREFYRQVGRIHEAIQMARQARATNPYHCSPIYQEGWMVGAFENLERGVRDIERAIEICPHRTVIRKSYIDFLYMMYGSDAQRADMLDHWDTLFLDDPASKPCYLAFLEARQEEAPEARAVNLACRASGVQPDYRVRISAVLGDVDLAYDIQAESSGDFNRQTVHLFYPEMADFRADPRFMPFVASLGLADYWLESDHWPDFCSEQFNLPYDCREEALRAVQERG